MKKLLQSLFLVLFIGFQAFAQERTVTGTVTAKDDGLPLPGVSVKVKGTTVGTVTGSDGRFSLQAANNQTLVFSYIGYKTTELPVSDVRGTIVLDVDANQLAEVVITGAYGTTQSSRSASSAVQVIDQAKLNPIRQTNLNNGLAGKVAGVQVRSQSSAALGRNTEIRLRGAAGFGLGTGALYVVDGTILPNADDINLDDIESVTVLQGPASSAQFGSQGAYGAIVITTKKGVKNSGLGVTLNLGATFETPYVLPNYQNTYAGGASADLMQYNWKAGDPVEWQALNGKYYHDYSDDASWGPKMVGQEYIPWYSWYPGSKYSYTTASLTPQESNARDYFNTGILGNNGITISQSGEKLNMRLSYNNQAVQGLIPNSSLNKNLLQLNTGYDLNKHFNIALNLNYVNQVLNGEIDDAYSSQSSGSFNQWFHRNLDMGIMKELRDLRVNGVYASWNHANPSAYDPSNPRQFYAGNYWYNFYTYYDLVDIVNQRDRLFGNAALTYKVNNDLNFTFTYRKQQNNTFGETRYSSQLANSGLQTTGNNEQAKGYYGTSTSYSNRQNVEFLATYKKQINDFTIDANAGTDFFSWSYKENGANTNNGLSVEDLYTVSNSKDQASIFNGRTNEKYRALIGRAVLGYKKLIYANITLRNDWFSTLPTDNNSILSKSFGGSFIVSDLLPASTKSWLSEVKLRGAYGEIPQALGTSTTTFGAYRYPGGLYGVNQFKFNGNLLMSTPDQFVDPSIRGAVSKSSEFGLDASFLNRRLGFEATYYTSSDEDFPYTLSVNGATGYSSILTNIGKISRQGLDLRLNAVPYRTSNFEWNLSGTFSRLFKNQVDEISKKYGITQIAVQGVWGTTMPYMVHREGEQWGQIYGNGIKRNADGVPILTSSGAYINDKVSFGSVLPKYTGGLQNQFGYKRFNVNVNLDYQYGGKFVSLSNQWGSYSGLTARTAVLNDKGNPIRDAVANGGGVHVTGVDASNKPVDYYVDAQTYFHGLYSNQTFDDYVYDLSFVKLREVALGYNIPLNKIGGLNKYISNANISVVGRNLWLLYATTKDFDPSEISSLSGETAQLPGTRGIGFNLRVGF